jgi:hypothetical protein
MRRHASAAALVGVLLSAALAAAETLEYGRDFLLHDSTGRTVGVLDRYWTVTFRVGVVPVVIQFEPEGIPSSQLFFTTLDCTGHTYMRWQYDVTHRAAAVVGPQKTIYTQAGHAQFRTVSSVRESNDTCRPLATPITDWFATMTSTGADLAEQFTPPFSVSMPAGGSTAPGFFVPRPTP